MTDLSSVDTADLRAELGRRDERRREEQAAAARVTIRETFGVCAAELGVTGHAFTLRSGEPFPEGPCGEEFRAVETTDFVPILVAPDDWPVLLGSPPPEQAWEIGAKYVVKLMCPRGHETRVERTQMYDEPRKPLF